MKLQLNLVMQAEDSVKQKIDFMHANNPNFNLDFIVTLGRLFMLAYGLKHEDNLSISSCKLVFPDLEPEESKKEVEK